MTEDLDETIDTFVQNIVNFVNTYGYDGVDLDWEKNVNVGQFDALRSKLRTAMPNKVITMAANPGNSQVAADSQFSLDQVNVMCYDFDWGSSVAWYVGALRNGTDSRQACDWDIDQFTSKGVFRNKIGVGMPFYGRRWPGVTQPGLPGNWNNASYLNLGMRSGTTYYYVARALDAAGNKSPYSNEASATAR